MKCRTPHPSNYRISLGDCSYRNVSVSTGAVVFDYPLYCSLNETKAAVAPPLPPAWPPVATAGTSGLLHYDDDLHCGRRMFPAVLCRYAPLRKLLGVRQWGWIGNAVHVLRG